MKLRISPALKMQFVEALVDAGTRETGGILMGESLGPDDFRLIELTVSPVVGGIAYFVRRAKHVLRPLSRFFSRTGRDYKRFNYLGEWHSHPSFSVQPSAQDEATMWDLVTDPDVGATFSVLLICKLNGERFEFSLQAYFPDRKKGPVELVWE